MWAVGRGGAAHARFLAWLASPLALAWHVLVLAVLLFHTITWLNLAPSAITLRVAGRRVPDAAIVLGHYLLWLAASAGGLVAAREALMARPTEPFFWTFFSSGGMLAALVLPALGFVLWIAARWAGWTGRGSRTAAGLLAPAVARWRSSCHRPVALPLGPPLPLHPL